MLRRLTPAALAIADQGVVSLGTFGLHVLVARLATPADYGVFVLAFSAIVLSLELQAALILEPMMIFGARRDPGDHAAYLKTVLKLQLGMAALLVAAALTTAAILLVVGSTSRAGTTVGAMALGLIGFQAREFTRSTFYTRQAPGRALVNDLIYLTLLAAGAVWATLSDRLTGSMAFTLLAAAGVASAAAGLAPLFGRSQKPSEDLRLTARRHWDYGRWMIATAGARWSSSELHYIIAGVLLGPAATGAFKALQNVFAPVSLALSGVANLFLPIASQVAHDRGRQGLTRINLAYGAGLLVGVVAYVAVVWGGSQAVLRLLYGETYLEYRHLIPLLGAGYLLMAALTMPALSLRALQHSRAVFTVSAVSTIASALAAVPLIKLWGLVGALLAWLLTFIIGSPLWLIEYRRAVRQLPPSAGAQLPQR